MWKAQIRGDLTQKKICQTFVKKYEISGLILEIGAKKYNENSGIDFRDIFLNDRFIGTDIEGGRGVDIIDDLENPSKLTEYQFDFGICCSVLEHIRRPWIAAETISTVIKPGGYMYVSVPWVWPYHPYPDDYFRFSFSGLQSLFPEFAPIEKLIGSLNRVVNANVENGAFIDRHFFENEKNLRLQMHMLMMKRAKQEY